MQIPSSVVIYIKKLIKETVSRNKTLRVDGFLTNDELPTVEAPEDKAVWKTEFIKWMMFVKLWIRLSPQWARSL